MELIGYGCHLGGSLPASSPSAHSWLPKPVRQPQDPPDGNPRMFRRERSRQGGLQEALQASPTAGSIPVVPPFRRSPDGDHRMDAGRGRPVDVCRGCRRLAACGLGNPRRSPTAFGWRSLRDLGRSAGFPQAPCTVAAKLGRRISQDLPRPRTPAWKTPRRFPQPPTGPAAAVPPFSGTTARGVVANACLRPPAVRAASGRAARPLAHRPDSSP